MRTITIDVPETIRYLSNWAEFKSKLPQGKFVLNKSVTDCGATTFFLIDTKPVVLCSPRTEILYTKHKKHKDTYLFKQENSKKKPNELKQDLKNYLMRNDNPFDRSKATPKILVTYDSFKYVAEVLSDMKLENDYVIVVDEAHCLYTDAPFKGDTEIEFMTNLDPFPNVVFLSATPYIKDYLDVSPEFANLDYIELRWKNTIVPKITYTQMKSPLDAITKIIRSYQKNGFFDKKIVDGVEVFSKEAVFFLNNVADIVKIIKKNGLADKDVNILCSETKEKKLDVIKMKRGHAPEEGKPHKTYTFCTKSSFEGTDFNSTNASTYIFADPSYQSLALDISLDLRQILGRQRLDSNPWKYEATFYYKGSLKFADREIFANSITEKDKATDALLALFEKATDDQKKVLIKTCRDIPEERRFTHHYISVVDDKVNGKAYLVKNTFKKMSEIRAWDVQSNQYKNDYQMLRAFEGEGFEMSQGNTGNEVIDGFLADFNTDNNFSRKMKCYAEFICSHPDLKSEIEEQPSGVISYKYKEYYDYLGPEKLQSLAYREDRIKAELDNIKSIDNLKAVIAKEFPVGSKFTNSEIKAKLNDVYKVHGIRKNATAKDLELYAEVKEVRILNDETGKRDLGFEILSYKK